LNHLGFATNDIGVKGSNRNGGVGVGSGVMFPHDAEHDHASCKQAAEDENLAGLGFAEIEKILRVHGWPFETESGSALVAVIADGGGENRFINTVKSFFNERSLRPPSGVPVTAK